MNELPEHPLAAYRQRLVEITGDAKLSLWCHVYATFVNWSCLYSNSSEIHESSSWDGLLKKVTKRHQQDANQVDLVALGM